MENAPRVNLTVEVSGRDASIPAAPFLSTVEDALAILQEINASVSTVPKQLLVWRIADMSVRCPARMTLVPDGEGADVLGPMIIDRYTAGFYTLDQSPRVTPRHFTDKALEGAKRIVSRLDHDLARITFTRAGGSPVVPTQRVAAHVEELLVSCPRDSFTRIAHMPGEVLSGDAKKPPADAWQRASEQGSQEAPNG